MYRNFCVGCGCSDCHCFIGLLLSVVAVLAGVLWRQWDLVVNLKTSFSFLIEIQGVLIGLVLSLTRSSVSSEIKTLCDGHNVVLWVQLPWMSILFILLSFNVNTGDLCAALLLPLSFRVGLLLADLARSSFLGERSILSWDSSAVNLLHLVYAKLSLLWCHLNLRVKGSTILISFSTCTWKVLF